MARKYSLLLIFGSRRRRRNESTEALAQSRAHLSNHGAADGLQFPVRGFGQLFDAGFGLLGELGYRGQQPGIRRVFQPLLMFVDGSVPDGVERHSELALERLRFVLEGFLGLVDPSFQVLDALSQGLFHVL